jgi:hypothetical protein
MASAEIEYTPGRSRRRLGLISSLLGVARRDVAARVAERRILPLEVVVALSLGICSGDRVSPFFFTHTRPSLRRLSLISVSFDWWSPLTGMQVG